MNDVYSLLEIRYTELFRQVLREELSTLSHSPTTTNDNAPINIEEAATFTGFAKSTIYSLVAKGEIPHHKKCGRLFFFRSELIDFIKSGDSLTKSALIDLAEQSFIAANKKRRA